MSDRGVLSAVLVYYYGLLYTCRYTEFGWLCGQCGKYTFPRMPRIRERCKSCVAQVKEKQFSPISKRDAMVSR